MENNIVTREEFQATIDGLIQPLANSVWRNYGYVKIPASVDANFRNTLITFLKEIIPVPEQINYEAVVDQIMYRLHKNSDPWVRTCHIDNPDCVPYTVESIAKSFYEPNQKSLQQPAFHPLPDWVMDLCTEHITEPGIIKKIFGCCADARIDMFKDEQEATDKGFQKEYALYTTAINHVVDKFYKTLYNRALTRYLQDPDTYTEDKYCTCCEFLNANYPVWNRDTYICKHDTYRLVTLCMQEFELTTDDTRYYNCVKKILNVLYKKLQEVTWDYRYFKTRNVSEKDITTTASDLDVATNDPYGLTDTNS